MQDGHVRRPGEGVFAIIVALCSLVLLWKAYDIDGFSALSSPGAVPLGAAATMVVSALVIAFKTLRSPKATTETIAKHILPFDVWTGIVLIILYAVLLVPLGFLPTSFLFMAIMIKLLSGRSVFFAVWTSAVSLLVIYLVFRIVFSVLMPEGIVPEGQIIATIGKLISGGK